MSVRCRIMWVVRGTGCGWGPLKVLNCPCWGGVGLCCSTFIVDLTAISLCGMWVVATAIWGLGVGVRHATDLRFTVSGVCAIARVFLIVSRTLELVSETWELSSCAVCAEGLCISAPSEAVTYWVWGSPITVFPAPWVDCSTRAAVSACVTM